MTTTTLRTVPAALLIAAACSAWSATARAQAGPPHVPAPPPGAAGAPAGAPQPAPPGPVEPAPAPPVAAPQPALAPATAVDWPWPAPPAYRPGVPLPPPSMETGEKHLRLRRAHPGLMITGWGMLGGGSIMTAVSAAEIASVFSAERDPGSAAVAPIVFGVLGLVTLITGISLAAGNNPLVLVDDEVASAVSRPARPVAWVPTVSAGASSGSAAWSF